MQYMKSKPKYDFQVRANREAAPLARVVFSAYYGSGKTYMSLQWLAARLKSDCQIWPCIVLCPKNLIDQWMTQINLHSRFEGIEVIGSNVEKRLLALNSVKSKYAIYVCNYDAYRSKKLQEAFCRKNFRSIIIDECTAFKNTRTKRFPALYKWISKIPYRALLTGRMITEGTEDVYGQMYMCDDGATFGKSFWDFRNRYMMPGPPWKPYDWQLRPGGAEAIAARLNHRCVVVTQQELAKQLPPVQSLRVGFDWPTPKMRKQYQKLKKEFEIDLPGEGDDVFMTQWAITKAAKMHQLCQGFMYKEDDGGDRDNVHQFHKVKIDWLEENVNLLLERGPLLIWANFNWMVKEITNLLVNKLKLTAGAIYGWNDDATNNHNEAIFKAGDIDILVLSQRKCARGLDLWRAATAVFTARDFSFELNENAEKRCHRSGSEIHNDILYIDLGIKNSIDGVVLKALTDKLKLSDAIIQHLKGKDEFNGQNETDVEWNT